MSKNVERSKQENRDAKKTNKSANDLQIANIVLKRCQKDMEKTRKIVCGFSLKRCFIRYSE